MPPEVLPALLLPILGVITGAFGWLAKQIADLKKEVKASNALHMECERARYQDGLKVQRLEFEMLTMRRTIEAAGLTKTESELLASEAAKETMILSEDDPEKPKGDSER